ncbi:MAG TPA: heme ABC exporter ATP-binding protein CcmA [Methylocella sp.]|nr:heme ABC exporter ATP-binding protein CcmA [Methylocella sp.]
MIEETRGNACPGFPFMQLSVSGLSVQRSGRAVISGLSFALSAGESLTVAGPNGAGKSTLLRALAGLLPPAGGEIRITPEAEYTLGELSHYIGHADGLKTHLTVIENLTFLAAILDAGHGGISAGAALARVGLSHAARLPVSYLSAGQKRRAALARLLIAKRPVWLLDEPSTALDSASKAMLGRIMAAHLAEGGIIIAATHAELDLAGQTLRLGEAA